MRKYINTPFLMAAGLSFVVGCSSLPDKAPMEFNQAQAELEAADDEDVSEFFPKTMDRAYSTLDHAVTMFNEADKYVDTQAKANKKQEATSEAEKAQQLAMNARDAYRKLRGWDADIQAFTDEERTASRLQDVEITLKNQYMGRGMARNTNAQSDQSKDSSGKPLATTQTVAHFGTSSTKLTAESRNNIRNIASVLRSHPDLHAEVLGYADARGSVALNKRLAEQRSQAVAEELEALGIPQDRVTIRPLGEQYSLNNKSSKGSLQLDRKVDVRLFTPEAVAE